MTQMWLDVVIIVVVVVGAFGFVTLIRAQTRMMSRRTQRRAEDLYPGYADPQRRSGLRRLLRR